MFSVENLYIETKKGQVLIKNLNFNINEGDKIAIIGEEGNGKSTLLKALINPTLIENYCLVKGGVLPKANIGYLEQKLSEDWLNFSVIDYFIKNNPNEDENYERYSELHLFEKELQKFGFNPQLLENNVLIRNLSGGERVKLQLARLACLDYDMYFLDEPTNDLDIETLEKLKQFILATNKPVVYISHDETLLEQTANKILHIEQLVRKTEPKATLEKCSYVEYITARQRKIEHLTQVAQSEKRERSKQEEILRNIKQKVQNALNNAIRQPCEGRILAKKMANVKAQEKRFAKTEQTQAPDVEEHIFVGVDNSSTLQSNKEVLNLNLPILKAGNNVLATNVELKIFGPERVAIVGNNGCGKSTLIKQLVPILKQTSGLKVGYLSQNYQDVLNYSNTAQEEVFVEGGINPCTMLGSLKFTQEEMQKQVVNLSEGQKVKLALAKLVAGKNNVLVLDEPTRNLSPLSNPVVRDMLKQYKGCIIAVSHDRKFIKEICNTVYVLNSTGLHKQN